MSRPKFIRRFRRKVWGGLLTIRVYEDGTAKMRFDHPSNDPEIEMWAAGRLLKLVPQWFADTGLQVSIGPVTWKDDPA